MSTPALHCISSMATRLLLAELAAAWQQRSGVPRAASSRWAASMPPSASPPARPSTWWCWPPTPSTSCRPAGHVLAGSRVDLVHSARGRRRARRRAAARHRHARTRCAQAVLAARSIGYSTGPSGTRAAAAVRALGHRRALRERAACRRRRACRSGALVARGEVELGFQQLSELMHLPGIDVVGAHAARAADIVTTFSARPCAPARRRPRPCARCSTSCTSPDAAELKRRHGMEPA